MSCGCHNLPLTPPYLAHTHVLGGVVWLSPCRPTFAKVVVPKGCFYTGSLNLTSNMTFKLESGAKLLSSVDEADYAQVPCLPNENREPIRNQGFIAGWDTENTRIEGSNDNTSIIDGHGDGPQGWWAKGGFTNASRIKYSRPLLINPMWAKNFSIVGVWLKDSAFWTLTPFACDGVYAADIYVSSPEGRGNTDGIHPDATANMLVERAVVDVGDDAVAITSGEMYAGRTYGVKAENITFRDSVFLHRFVCIGSGTAAGIKNITFERCTIGRADRPNADAGINIKTMRGNGGWIEDITFKNLVIHGRVDEWNLLPASPIRIAMWYALVVYVLPAFPSADVRSTHREMYEES